MDPGRALRQALEALMGRSTEPEPGLPRQPRTWAELKRAWGGNPALADAAGYPKGSRERERFLRNVRRWESGQGLKNEDRRLFRRLSRYTPGRKRVIAERRRIRREIPRTFNDVLALIRRKGLTVMTFYGELEVPSGKAGTLDIRPRAVDWAVFIPPGVLEEVGFHYYAAEGDWDEAAQALANAWADEYGIGRVEARWGDMEPLELRIGNHADQQRRAA